jgi:aspartyl-tRNA(Asn)/glutamyl-tRNA(Gln) amidotransferase subunit C
MVTKAAVRHLARLARLRLEEVEVERLVPELSGILEHVEELAAVSVEGVAAAAGAAEGSAPLREDVAGPDALTQQPSGFAPEWSDGFFTVPRLAAHEENAESDA